MTSFTDQALILLQHLGIFGYALVLLISLAESLAFVGSIVPGATLVVFAGFLASQGYFDVVDLIIVAAIGAMFGDGLSYWLGTKGMRFFHGEQKWLKQAHLERGERFFKQHGGKSVFLGRFIGLLRPIIPFVAGLSKMNKWQFFLWNITSAIVWAVSHVLLGYFFGDALNVIEAWSYKIGIILAVLLLGFIILRKTNNRVQ